MKRPHFGTRLGFYLASLGSAFGLGNLWRFPYVVRENGGGAFVFLFFIFLFLFGMALMVVELAVGKIARSSSILAFRKIHASRFASVLGYLSPTLSVLVLSYYVVVSGWVLYFFFVFLNKLIFGGMIDSAQTLSGLRDSGSLQIALALVHVFIVTLILARGVEMGIERAVGLFMPVLILLVLALCGRSLSLPGAESSLKQFLYPDFSRLTLSSFARALGQALFTLGLSFGTMITFGSYLDKKVFIPFAAFRVVLLDAVLSLFAGILIFPLIAISSSDPRGPELLFQTVPAWLGTLSGGLFFGTAFFLCLYLAALGASLGLLETVVANLQEVRSISRWKSSALAGGLCFLLSVIPALSSTCLKFISFHGRSLLEIVDALLSDVGLPVAALLLCVVLGRRLNVATFGAELLESETVQRLRLFNHLVWIVRWLLPIVVVIALSLQIYDFAAHFLI